MALLEIEPATPQCPTTVSGRSNGGILNEQREAVVQILYIALIKSSYFDIHLGMFILLTCF